MEPLDPELYGLVQAERSEVEPNAADRERVAKSLGARVGVGLGLGVGLLSTPAAGAAAAGTGVGLALKLGLALAVIGSAAAVVVPQWNKSQREASPVVSAAPVVAAAASPVLRAPEPEVKEAAAAEASEPSAETSPAKASSATAARVLPPLAEEARLLRQAQQALRDGKPGAALASLGEHQQRFPRGQLALERSAARITALCALGQKQQAEREAKVFLVQHGSSGLAAQVRASCGSAATRP